MRAVSACAGDPAGEERDEHDGGERLRRPRAERRRPRRCVTGSPSRPATTAAGSGWASVTATALRITSAADAEQRHPDRPRDVARRVARLLRGGHARVEADEDPAADGQRGQQPGAHRAAGQRLGARASRRGATGPARGRRAAARARCRPTRRSPPRCRPSPRGRARRCRSAPTTAQTTTSTMPVSDDRVRRSARCRAASAPTARRGRRSSCSRRRTRRSPPSR